MQPTAEYTDVFKFGTQNSALTSTSALRLCWGPTAGALYTSIGFMEVLGPRFTNYECTLAVSCVFTITGNGLYNTGGLRIQPLADECGSAVGTAQGFTYLRAETLAAKDWPYETYDLGTETVRPVDVDPPVWRICWGFSPWEQGIWPIYLGCYEKDTMSYHLHLHYTTMSFHEPMITSNDSTTNDGWG